MKHLLKFAAAGLLVAAGALFADPVGSSFTYQGLLTVNGVPATGTFDFEFRLFNVENDGTTVADDLQIPGVPVNSGAFTVVLDFGISPFTGQKLWLEIGVHSSDDPDSGFTTLSPRQELNSIPFALLASTVRAGSINSESIAEQSVGSVQIADLSIQTVDIANDAVSQEKLAPDSVGTVELINNSIGAADIDSSQVQRRITGSCPAGSYVHSIAADGSVGCETVFSRIVIEKQTFPDALPGKFDFTGEVIGQIGDGEQLVIDRLPGVYQVTEVGLQAPIYIDSILCDDTNSFADINTGIATIQLDAAETVNCTFWNANSVASQFSAEKQTVPNGRPEAFYFSGDLGLSGFLTDGEQLTSPVTRSGIFSVSESPRWSFDLQSIECDDDDSTGDISQGIATFVVEWGEHVTCVFTNIHLGGTVWRFETHPYLFPDIAMGSDGYPIISFALESGQKDLMFLKCNDIACGEGDDYPVELSNYEGSWEQFSSIAVGSDQNPVIAYSEEHLLRVAKCNDPQCTSVVEPNSIFESEGYVIQGVSLAIGWDGNPVVAHAQGPLLRVTRCNDVACVGEDEAETIIDGPDGDLIYPEIVVGSDGFPVVSYINNQGLKVAHCNDAACAGSNETVTVISTNVVDTVGYSAIAIGEDSYPVIAHWSWSNEIPFGIEVINCNDLSCAGDDETSSFAYIPQTPEGFPTIIPRTIDMAIGHDGNPLIVADVEFRNTEDTQSTGEFVVIKCNDFACAGDDETITIGPNGSTEPPPITGVGFAVPPAVVIGLDGNPVMVIDGSVLRCGSADCSY